MGQKRVNNTLLTTCRLIIANKIHRILNFVKFTITLPDLQMFSSSRTLPRAFLMKSATVSTQSLHSLDRTVALHVSSSLLP